jgi:cholesterol oxidase
VLVLSGAGVGGGSHVYANTLYVPRSSSSTRRNGRASPTGPTSWRPISTRRHGCSALFAIRTCRPMSIASCGRSRSRWGEGRPSTRPRWVSISGAGRRGRRSVLRRGWTAAHRLHLVRQVQHRLRPQRQEQADDELPLPGGKARRGVHQLHEVYDLVPLDGGGFEVHARHPGWAQRAAHLHQYTYTAEQVIVAAYAYGSAKLLLHSADAVDHGAGRSGGY